MSKTVTPDEWVELVPDAHGKSHAQFYVTGGDVYLVAEVEPLEAVPYGQLVRDGDTVAAHVEDAGSVLKPGKPVYARAVDTDATVRTVLDQSVNYLPRREIERPGDSASREDRRDTFAYLEEIQADSQALLSFPSGNLESNNYPVFVESVTLAFQNRTVSEAMFHVVIFRDVDEGPDVRRAQRTGSTFSDITFDPAIRLDEGDNVSVEAYNPSASAETAEAIINYRYLSQDEG